MSNSNSSCVIVSRCRVCVCGSSSPPVVVRAVLALSGVGRNGADDLLSVCVDQLDRVDGQVLIEVSPALGCVRTQVTLVLPLFCNNTTHTDPRPQLVRAFARMRFC